MLRVFLIVIQTVLALHSLDGVEAVSGPLSTSITSFPSCTLSWTTPVFSITNSSDTLWTNLSDLSFGAGTNSMTYLYGFQITSTTSSVHANITAIYVRSLNNTMISSLENDTSDVAVSASDLIMLPNPPIPVVSLGYEVASSHGFAVILSFGYDENHVEQIYVSYINPFGSPPTTLRNQLTSFTSFYRYFGLGNVWYDSASEVFFYTYWANVTIYIGGLFATNGSAFFSSTYTVSLPFGSAELLVNVMGGGDNWGNASNIYVVCNTEPITGLGAVYVAKVPKRRIFASTSSAILLVNDTSTLVYTPAGIWASNSTFGISLNLVNSSNGSLIYSIINFLNGSFGVDTGTVLFSRNFYQDTQIFGLPTNSGNYMLIQQSANSSEYIFNYTISEFYANGTNIFLGNNGDDSSSYNNTTTSTSSSSVFLGTFYGIATFYEDSEGAQWFGWTTNSTASNTSWTNGYLSRLQQPTLSVCNSNSSSPNEALSCETGTFLFEEENECLSSCPSQYWADNSTHSCQQCDSTCATCGGENSTDCTSCAKGTYLVLSQCLSVCPAGYSEDSSLNLCQKSNNNHRIVLYSVLVPIFFFLFVLGPLTYLCFYLRKRRPVRPFSPTDTEGNLNGIIKIQFFN